MEENVALDSTQQKQFAKSIKGIKKLIKKKHVEPESDKPVSAEDKDKTKKRRRKDRGLVYLAHIPHGFYENEMTQYFKQFGMVTNVRVIRSKRTGNSKGFAFVEFKEPTVAQIVAETMNNYLMGKRLLKAEYIPPEKQKLKAMRKRWNSTYNPGNEARLKNKKEFNAEKTDVKELQRTRKTLSNLLKTKEKLSNLGIDYNFFMPVDVPEELLPELKVKEDKMTESSAKQATKGKKGKKETIKVEDIVNKGPLKKKAELKKDEIKKEDKKLELKNKNKKNEVEVKVDKKQQKQKEQKLKEKGVKPAHNFIKVQEESSDDSDSLIDFDSDEYEKVLGDDDGSLSEGDDDGSLSEGDDDGSLSEGDDDGSLSEDDEKDVLQDDGSEVDSDEIDAESSDEEELPREVKVPLVMNPNKLKQASKKANVPKRKTPHAPPVTPKKSKFEKNQKNTPLVKKQFKKKK